MAKRPEDKARDARQNKDPEEQKLRKNEPREEHAEDEVDEASMESFPASDAPSWSPTTATGAESERERCQK